MNYDTLHPAGEDREWNESFYFNFYDAASDICGFMRIGLKPNMDERSMFFFLMLPDGSAVGTRGAVPLGDGSLSVNGLELVMVEPERRWRLRFHGPMARMGAEGFAAVSMDLTFDCLAPTYDYRRSVGAEGERIARKVASEHLEQFGHVAGTIEIDGQRIAVDGLGERDHSWGVRDWNAPKMWVWLTAEFDKGTALNVTKLFTEEGEVSAGFVHLDGRTIALVHAEVAPSLDDKGRPRSLQMTLTDEEGGKHTVTAEVMRSVQLPFVGRNGKSSSLMHETLSRYHWSSKTGYGIAEFLIRQ